MQSRRTPAQQIVPHEVLLLGKHGHHDERVQINALAQHPEVIATKEVEMDEQGHFAARLTGEKSNRVKRDANRVALLWESLRKRLRLA